MTGPEHYKAAEEALSILDVEREPDAWLEAIHSGELGLAVAAAQVHATLALAAATALQPSGYSVVHAEWRAWRDACKTPADAQERNR